MSNLSYSKYLYLAYLARPAADRWLFRQIKRRRLGRIVELGIGSTRRSIRMIQVASRSNRQPVQYTGIDLFETRPDGEPRLNLKEAHQSLSSTQAEIRLVPGDALSGLRRTANSLAETDLVLFSAGQPGPSSEDAWFYIPRMIHLASIVVCEELTEAGESSFQLLTSAEVAERAGRTNLRRAA